MTLYCIVIDGKQYQVNLTGDTATVNGENLDVELISLDENGLYLLKRGNAAIEMYIHQISQGNLEVLIGREIIEACIDNNHRRLPVPQGQDTNGELRAPMPGVVVEILAKAGQDICVGDVLVILESMKMKMQMRSSVAGQVKTIPVESGQVIEKGALLVEISQSL
jgi:biotin carboxyl carrier protein